MGELVKAQLIELQQDFQNEKDGGQRVSVQFNPETLKVTFANQLVQPQGGDQAAGNSGRQFVGAGTTKLALTLWFDVTAMTEDVVDDVRRLTQKVIYFMTPAPAEGDATKLAPPGVRFIWGSFLFDGMVEGLEESLEYFSPDGKPLRANLTLTLSQQKILEAKFEGDGKVPSRPGHKPLSSAKAGDSLQSMAGAGGKGGFGVSLSVGVGGDWQAIASANGIEDPLRLAPGKLIDLDVRGGASGGFGASVSAPSFPSPRISVGATLAVD
ncbi:LysM peptidoglycan-binding domain-containing protein [soil metagenome]